ncbi:hypothetical protein FN846DRAFT_931000 [Sphaerosporella brunnea]|uniref:Uncharacterized protein n=1 Tax=Sphaerosporella brunnea TaxID=1250544 RepID=A0A5J5F8T8_9PEZI|nr:hypothetical protein FN846DRAFT_931000 [Sphaerosporella brunnea]
MPASPIAPPPIPVPTAPVGPPVDDDAVDEGEYSGFWLSRPAVDGVLFHGPLTWGSSSESLDLDDQMDNQTTDEDEEVEEDSDHGLDDSTSSVRATATRPPRKLSIDSVANSTAPNATYSSTEEDEDSDDAFEESEPEPAQPPVSFIFSTTEHNAYLLPTTFLTPTVVCKGFLHQPFPSTMHQFLGQIDRLNMVAPIPELSLVVAGSQKGRVGIFRLTRAGPNFGMRLDMVLPRERGMEAGELDVETRPPSALLGLAVSPIQGKEMRGGGPGSESFYALKRRKERQRGGGWRGIEGRRRWRLVLVYMDGSVLSYELGREQNDEGPGGDLLGMGSFLMV